MEPQACWWKKGCGTHIAAMLVGLGVHTPCDGVKGTAAKRAKCAWLRGPIPLSGNEHALMRHTTLRAAADSAAICHQR